MTKDFLMMFKRNVLVTMEDQGALRAPYENCRDSHYIPALLAQVQSDLQSDRENLETTDTMLNVTLRSQAKQHRDAMVKEYKRREERKKEEIRLQRLREEEKKKRKDERRAARERHRLQQLLEKI